MSYDSASRMTLTKISVSWPFRQGSLTFLSLRILDKTSIGYVYFLCQYIIRNIFNTRNKLLLNLAQKRKQSEVYK